MGDGNKMPTEEEKQTQKVARRSIVAGVNIPKGTIITEAMLDIKRPGIGIEPKNISLMVGKRARKDIRRDALVTWDTLGEES